MPYNQQRSFQSYLRAAQVGAAIPNILINPLLAWLLNRHVQAVPLIGAGGIAFDTGVTAFVLPFVVTLFIAPATRRDLSAGAIVIPEERARDMQLLAWLPTRTWALAFALGALSAALLVPLTLLMFALAGVSSLSVSQFAFAKAFYTPVLAAVVVRCIIRHIMVGAFASR